MPEIFVLPKDNSLPATLEAMNKATQDWTAMAARGECSWICSSCCVSFEDGMPDECPHEDAGCTAIIKRDKEAALGNQD